MEEKQMEFRMFLVKLFDQLSNTDRCALHFALENQISGVCRDQSTPSDSLHVLNSLFDQNLITEDMNCDYLIRIFEQIQCHNIADQLREYQLQNTRSLMIENERSKNFSHRWKLLPNDDYSFERKKTSSKVPQFEFSSSCEQENSIISPTPINSYEDTRKLNSKRKKRLFSIIGELFNNNRRTIPMIIIVFLFFTNVFSLIIFGYLWIQTSKNNGSSVVIQQEMFYVMKESLQYGTINRDQNELFDDAKDNQLSYIDRCIGVEMQWTTFSLMSIRFLYSNKQSLNISPNRSEYDYFSSFMLNSDEKIQKINLYQNISEGISRIVGIQFRTSDGRKTEVFGSNDGHFLTESFEFYTFAYSKGIQSKAYGIEMLQFVWIKSISASEQISTVPYLMVETCEFTFTSTQTFQNIYVTGYESSWYDLKRRFNQYGEQLNISASYYEKTSLKGPELFAIVNHSLVFYHHKQKWHKYVTAHDIECTLIASSELNFTQTSLSP